MNPIKNGPPKEIAPHEKNFHLLAVALIFFFIAIAYGHTLNYSFQFDDFISISENRVVHIRELSRETVLPILLGSRPVANLSYALNFYFGRLEPGGYHLLNILIHFLTTLLIYILFLKTLSFVGGRFPDIKESQAQISLLGALLWAVHPVQTQAVTYVVQRMASLAAFFYLLSILSYIEGRLKKHKLSFLWYLISAFAALFAFGTKENTLTLPLIIFLYELFFISRFQTNFSRQQLMMTLSLLVALIFGLVWIAKVYHSFGTGFTALLTAQYGVEEMDPILRVMTEWRVIILYLSLLIFPYPGRMNLDYDFPLSSSLFHPMSTFLSLLVILSLVGSAIWKTKKYPLVSFSILWFFITLAIESTFLKLDLVFEHRLYLPSVMLFLLLALGIDGFARRFFLSQRKVATWIGAVLIVFLVVMTYERNKVWRTEVSLWSDAAEKSPHKFRVLLNTGKAYWKEKQWDQAKLKFIEALRLNPTNEDALIHMGYVYQREGNIEMAMKNYQAVLQFNNNDPLVHNDLGTVFQGLNKMDLAEREYKEAIRLNPNIANFHNNLGKVYLSSNHLDLAVFEFQNTVALNPNFPEVHSNLGFLFLKAGKLKEAYSELELGVRVDPENSFAQFNFAFILELMGRKEDAVKHYEEAIKWALPEDIHDVEMVRQKLKTLKG